MVHASLEPPAWAASTSLRETAKRMQADGVIPLAVLDLAYQRLRPELLADDAALLRDGVIRPEDAEALVESLRGAAVLVNTYWVRFNHPMFKHADAVRNTLTLFGAA